MDSPTVKFTAFDKAVAFITGLEEGYAYTAETTDSLTHYHHNSGGSEACVKILTYLRTLEDSGSALEDVR